MKRITREHTVPAHRRYQVREPVAEVTLGEAFVVETSNFRTPVILSADDVRPAVFREREETGPIYVRGIAPGDVLAIHIEEIQNVGHASGGWWNNPEVPSFLPIEEEYVVFPGGLRAPKQMMIGDISVAPTEASRGNPADNGGNMDFRDVARGNTLCLKAEVEGGLLVLGDVHAAQGDGEILGLAAECAADVTLRITREERYCSDRPLIVKSHSFVAIACRPEYVEARDVAVRDATQVLSRLTGCSEQEAYLYVTTVGHLRNGAVWGMGQAEIPLVVAVEVPFVGA